MKTNEHTYINGFEDAADILRQFEAEDEPDATLLYAVYDQPDWEGYALVVYELNDELYEVEGNHCSCFGLEYQWWPLKVSPAYLANRKLTFCSYDDAQDREAFQRMVDRL
jgi:hypothetical protein